MESEEKGHRDIQEQVLNETLSGLSREDGAETAEACCVICLSAITEACTARPCSHRNFDFLCLASWLQLKSSCPLCKAEISAIQYDFADEGSTWKTYKVPKIGLQRGGAEGDSSSTSTPPRSSSFTHPYRRGGLASRGYARRVASQQLASTSADADDRAREILARRRHVYRNRLYSLHVGSNSASRYREVTPAHFQTDADLLSRARTWVRRELQVFEFLNDDASSGNPSADGGGAGSEGRRARRQNNAEFVLEYVVAILKTVDMQASSGHAENLLSDFLGREHCRVFLHELRSFVRSPYSVEAWDRHVQYDEAQAAPRPREEDGSANQARGGSQGVRPMRDCYRPAPLERHRPRDRWKPYRSSRDGLRGRGSWRPG